MLRILEGDQLLDWLDSQTQPRVLRAGALDRLYPRIYNSEPSGGPYGSPRYLSRLAARAITDSSNEGLPWTSAAFSRMATFGMPCFWPTPEIAAALSETAPPLEGLHDIYWPFEAGTFMMPKGVIGDVSWIAYAWLLKGKYPSPLLEDVTDVVLSDRLGVFYGESSGEWSSWFFDADDQLFQAEERKNLIAEYSRDVNSDCTEQELSVADQVTCFVLNLIQLMCARPEVIAPETPQTKQPRGANGSGSPRFWQPRVIGADYRLRQEPKEDQGGSHASSRAHWVRGYWREQPWGEGRRLRKTLWIEPFIRGLGV
jgi:hypothetical protein